MYFLLRENTDNATAAQVEAGYVRDEVVERGKKSKLSSDCEEAKSAEESTSKTTLKEWKSLYTDLIRNLYPKFHESEKSQRLLGKRRRGGRGKEGRV